MPPSPAHPDDYDSSWKSAIEHALPEFVGFYFPAVHRRIDWTCGHHFLDKELQRLSKGAALGRHHVDKLARVFGHDG